MIHRRSRLQQSLDVLEAVSEGPIQSTMISRRTGLPWNAVKGILDGFTRLGYLTTEQVGKRKTYSLTKKGHRAYVKLREVALELGPVLEPTSVQNPPIGNSEKSEANPT